MNCDQAFDALTSRGALQNRVLAGHLAACPRCRAMADVLEPALELFAPVREEHSSAPAEAATGADPIPDGMSAPSESDWAETAPWRHNVQSARRARRDGLKIIGTVVVVALLTFAFANIGRDPAPSGFLPTLAAAECIRESSAPMEPEQAISACVACHLQLSEIQLDQPARVQAEKMILSCVDCHLDSSPDPGGVHVAAAEAACLFRAAGG